MSWPYRFELASVNFDRYARLYEFALCSFEGDFWLRSLLGFHYEDNAWHIDVLWIRAFGRDLRPF